MKSAAGWGRGDGKLWIHGKICSGKWREIQSRATRYGRLFDEVSKVQL